MNKDDEQTDLYKAIDDLVRNHDRREPYITNVVKRVYRLVKDGVPRQYSNGEVREYRRGYSSGYQAGKRSAKR